MFHGECFTRRSGSSMCFTASFFFESRSRAEVSRRIVSSQVGIVLVFHSEYFPRRSESYVFSEQCVFRVYVFHSNLFFAYRNRLGVTACFFFPCRFHLNVSRRVVLSQFKATECFKCCFIVSRSRVGVCRRCNIN